MQARPGLANGTHHSTWVDLQQQLAKLVVLGLERGQAGLLGAQRLNVGLRGERAHMLADVNPATNA